MFRIILDTNVLINADKGSFSFPARIMQAVIDGELDAFVSHKIRRENNLIRRRLIKNPEMHELIERFTSATIEITPSQHFDYIETDHEDDKFIDTAHEAQADFIVTDDHDLLDIGRFEETEIVTPQEFWTRYENELDPEGVSRWQEWVSNLMKNDKDY